MTSTESVGRIRYIDGLRAIAVLAVVVFHLGIGLLPNGFLGVDVFFVISGYVITRSLSRGDSGRILPFLEHFYRRRFWRLMPPLAVVVAATLVAVALFVPPVWISRHVVFTGIGAVTGTSNIVLTVASGAGYFQAESDFNPFLHTWSLGVEEQFYLLYPVIFWLVALAVQRGKHRWIRWSVPALGVLSFILAIWMSAASPTFAFYMLPTRFWELAAGAMAFQFAGWVELRVPLGRLRTWIAWAALAVVIGSFFGPTTWVSPLPAGIAPVLGTILLLWFATSGSSSSVERWLSARPATYIGRISYSLYLWHWPVIVLLRWTTGISSPLWIGVGVVAMFLLAMASYHWIERPFQSARLTRWALPSIAFVLVGVLALGGVAATFNYGLKKEFVRFLPSKSAIVTERGWQPQDMPDIGPPVSSTVTDPSRPELLVMGDSHAGAYQGAATLVANDLNMRLQISTLPGCGYTLLAPIDVAGTCPQQQQALNSLHAGDVVLLAALRVPRYNDMDGSPSPIYEANSPAEVASRAAALTQTEALVAQLQARGIHVIVDSPKPLFEDVPLRCADWYNKDNPVCRGRSAIPKSELLKRAEPASTQLKKLMAAYPSTTYWDVFDALCPGTICEMFDGRGHPLYEDTDHPSGWGNEVMAPSLKRAVIAAQTP